MELWAWEENRLELEGAELLVDDLPDDFVGGHGCRIFWLRRRRKKRVRRSGECKKSRGGGEMWRGSSERVEVAEALDGSKRVGNDFFGATLHSQPFLA